MLVLPKNSYLGNQINLSQLAGCCIGRVDYSPDSSFNNMHCHENPHLSLVVRGSNIEKRQNKSFERFPGIATFYHAGESHQNTYSLSGSTHINIEITSSWLRDNLSCYNPVNLPYHFHCFAAISILKIYGESQIADEFSIDTIHLLLLDLFAEHQRKYLRRPSWINKIEEQLNDRWNETPALHDLSAATSVHPITISKHFSKYFGCTLGEYMRRQKVTRAIALIKTGNTTLTDISYECGFADQSHFIRTFKQLTGFLPGAYQRL